MAGTSKGGLGSASLDLGGGLMVGALVACNPMGSVYMADGETFWAWPFEIDSEFGGKRPGDLPPAIDPFAEQTRLAALGRLTAGANTTIAVVAVTGDLTAGDCKRLAMMAQDGLPRAIRPAHTPFDGDTVFAVAGDQVALGPDPARRVKIALLGAAAADCLARAIARGVYEAGRE
jgi:L-aminopeptidase/D-esterase-like protein